MGLISYIINQSHFNFFIPYTYKKEKVTMKVRHLKRLRKRFEIQNKYGLYRVRDSVGWGNKYRVSRWYSDIDAVTSIRREWILQVNRKIETPMNSYTEPNQQLYTKKDVLKLLKQQKDTLYEKINL